MVPSKIASTGKRGTAAKQVKELFDQNPIVLTFVRVTFDWRRFTKALLNAFDYLFSIEFRFEELQLVITLIEQKSQLASKRYPHQLSNEEIRSIASTLAKMTLESIRQQTDKKPK